MTTTAAPKPNPEDVAVLAAGGDRCGGGEGGSDGGKVEVFGTVTAVLQFGHGAITPIWAGVAEMC